ncbi:hypothetical protein [Salipiger mucosus]|uniref:Uncharacterized protein n=1 Tax=Salipiger mucosus DSM 16094 TaxID=1123237 RepID=S9QTR7_9RHOB|nr:hypothetical protein [Salipiger mucosus]EPX84756.1 hypothetical protein Salmuc_01329 [Salipiger mucosus DSM 16094]
MDIEDLTSEADLDTVNFKRHRKISADEHGELRLVGMELGDEEQDNLITSSALVLLPADEGMPRMICAGKVGSWMKLAADEFILEREHMKVAGGERTVTSNCSEAVFEAAVRQGFSLMQHPNGELDFSKTDEDHRVSITNVFWSGEEDATASHPVQAGHDIWRVTRAELEQGEEVAHTVVWEGSSLKSAFKTAFQLGQIDPALEVDGSLKKFHVFETRQEFLDATGVGDLPLDMAIEDVGPEPEMDPDVDPVELIFREEHTPAGIQMAMF